ncbi:MAG: hypothetical protein DDT40_01428 [candidate division WS2 bacterium]|nr:hypothetical protein [Candidatus Psychracetigena formicireducens]
MLNKGEVIEVIGLLGDIVENSMIEVIAVLMKLHYGVTAEFIHKVYLPFSESLKGDFICNFLNHEKIVKNTGNFGLTRSLVVLSELLQVKDENVYTVLKWCLKRAYGKDGGQKAGKLLSKFVLDKTEGELFQLDFLNWEAIGLREFSAWAGDAVKEANSDLLEQAYIEFMDKYSLPQRVLMTGENRKETVEEPLRTKSDVEQIAKVKSEGKEKGEKAVLLMVDLHAEINRIVNERTLLQMKVNEMASQLERTRAEKDNLVGQRAETISKNNELLNIVRNRELELKVIESKMAEMDERLRSAFSVDKYQQNQELASLKNDLAKRLRLEYKDFKELEAKEPTPQYYEAVLCVVENIFNTLRIKGINVKLDNEE